MLLTVTTTHAPATDLGYLLAKNPARSHVFDLAHGRATVYFPEATEARCTAVLQVELDGTALARKTDDDSPLGRYVNDRAYAASSLLSVAMTRAFGTAMAGRSRERPTLAATPLPLELTIVGLPCRGGEAVVRRLFEPLGWAVELAPVPVAEGYAHVPLFDVTLRGVVRLADALTHVYVLVPVLDDQKHYWIGDDEVDKLLANGGDWLAAHPDRELVAQRYLGHHRHLVRHALERLVEGEEVDDEPAAGGVSGEDRLEAPLRLADLRMEAVVRRLRDRGARTIGDLGCGEGRLLQRLARESGLRKLVGVEVSAVALSRAQRRLEPERLPSGAPPVELQLGSITYADERWAELDALVLVEVIEHVDAERLPRLEDAVFGATRPRVVIVTTPNAEVNVRFPNLAPGAFRHRDHRFEWDRATFRAWAEGVAARHGYTVTYEDVGPTDELGGPTQLAEFTR